MSESLWGSLDNLPIIKTPRVILNEQGEHLKRATKGFLTVAIGSTAMPDKSTELLFNIVAPGLNNYRVEVLACRFGSLYFPATIFSQFPGMKPIRAEGPEEFEIRLKEILQSEAVRSVVSGLLSEVTSFGPQQDV